LKPKKQAKEPRTFWFLIGKTTNNKNGGFNMTIGELKELMRKKGYPDSSEIKLYTLDNQDNEYDLILEEENILEYDWDGCPLSIKIIIPYDFSMHDVAPEVFDDIEHAVRKVLRDYRVSI
jgi:hypothetical protein